MDCKYCPRCKTTLPLTSFHRSKARKDGVQSLCIECFKITQAKYLENNREKVLNGLRKYREDNNDYFLNWRRLNKDKNARKQMERVARKLNATPSWLTKEQREEIDQLYWLAKDLRSVSGQDYHVDHIVPLKGKNVCGLHVPWNLQVLPSDLNLSKSNKLL